MNLIEVSTPTHEKEFIEMAVRLYRNEKNWIRPLDADIEGLFHPEKNKLFRNGAKSKRCLLQDEKGFIGRVAAFINPKMKGKRSPAQYRTLFIQKIANYWNLIFTRRWRGDPSLNSSNING